MFTIALTLLMTLAPGSREPAADSVATFSRLEPGDELRVFFRSQCYVNGAKFKLVFRSAPHTVALSRISRVDKGSREPLPTREIIAALSDSAVAGLDALLSSYRADPQVGYAATDYIELSQVRGRRIVGIEAFTDRSCTAARAPGIVTFPELISRVSWADAARRANR